MCWYIFTHFSIPALGAGCSFEKSKKKNSTVFLFAVLLKEVLSIFFFILVLYWSLKYCDNPTVFTGECQSDLPSSLTLWSGLEGHSSHSEALHEKTKSKSFTLSLKLAGHTLFYVLFNLLAIALIKNFIKSRKGSIIWEIYLFTYIPRVTVDEKTIYMQSICWIWSYSC